MTQIRMDGDLDPGVWDGWMDGWIDSHLTLTLVFGLGGWKHWSMTYGLWSVTLTLTLVCGLWSMVCNLGL